MRKLIRALTLFLILVLGAGLGLVGYATYMNSPVRSNGGESVAFTIEKGENLKSVAERLEREGLLRSADFLVVVAKLKESEKLFQAGSYLVPRGKSALDLHDYFIQGSQFLIRTTIPEGWTLSRIADYLEAKKISSKEAFLAAAGKRELLDKFGIPGRTAEGYIFPDTYFFPEDYPAEKALGRMVDNFYKKLAEIYPEYREMTQKALAEKIILASIVEREYRSADEAPLMASVFSNRLGVNMALGSCATVEYVITEIQKKPHPEFLTFDDLDVASPYNTYKHPGLPPGPISNPGKTALLAAFSPAKTDYWYFVLKDPATGKHFFSRNLQEHNRAKVVYLKKITSGS